MKNKIQIEPYQIFFLSGLLISVLGVGVWILFALGWIQVYPLRSHGFLMIMGFLFAYINGFLMTAVPKMLQASAAKPFELIIGLSLFWIQVVSIFTSQIHFNFALALLQILFLMYFISRRFLERKIQPPKSFLFLPFGFFCAVLGSLILAFPESTFSVEMSALGRNLVYQGFALNLILGLGSQLIPTLTRVQGALNLREVVLEKFQKFLVMAVCLNSSFLVEFWGFFSLAAFLKFTVISWIAVQNFKILKPRQIAGILGAGLRFSVYCLCLGFLLAAILPQWGIHFLHVSYIGGFALLTILISTRIVLAHGGYGLSLEIENKQIAIFIAGVIAIIGLRLLLGFQIRYRGELLWTLFLAWVFLCTLWSFSFLRKLLKQRRVP